MYHKIIILLTISFISLVRGSESLSLWIFSDVQPWRSGEWRKGYKNSSIDSLDRMFQMSKKTEVDAFLGAGDIGHYNSPSIYEEIYKVYDYYYGWDSVGRSGPKNLIPPKWLMVLGNHDYFGHYWVKHTTQDDVWGSKPQTRKNRRDAFKVHLHVEDLNPHVVLKGIDIIGISLEDGLDATKADADRLEKELRKAVLRDATKPIIVFAHTATPNTVYGCEHYNKKLDAVLKNYPQVVYLSGHSHFPLEDERTIHQRDYTSISTGCMCTMFMETGTLRYPDRAASHYAIHMTIDEKEIVVHRYQLTTQREILDDGKPWRLKLPLKRENFTYNPETRWRNKKRTKPCFPPNSTLKATPMLTSAGVLKGITLKGTAAQHENFVHSYYVTIEKMGKDGKWQHCEEIRRKQGGKYIKKKEKIKFYGDFYQGIENQKSNFMVEIPVWPINNDFQGFMFEGKTHYRFTIRAMESFGALSENYLRCTVMTPEHIEYKP